MSWRESRILGPVASTSRCLLRATRCSKCYRSRTQSASARILRDPVELYQDRVSAGSLDRDENQLRIVHELRKVQRSLLEYRPSATLVHLLDTMRSGSQKADLASRRSALDRPDWLSSESLQEIDRMSERERRNALVRVLSGEEELLRLQTPTGFLLTGPPGTGKSLLMDIFFESLPTPHKTRRHYHHFLLSLYHQVFLDLTQRSAQLDAEEALAHLKAAEQGAEGYPWSRREEARSQAITRGWRSVFAGGKNLRDPALTREYVLASIARDMIINDGWLLAFDEVQLVDVAGASILRRVLEHFWRLGGVVVGTSNRLPDDLYQKGIQREQFLTFLAILQNRCPVLELRSSQDYRRAKQSANAAAERPVRSWYLESESDAFETACSAVMKERGSPQVLVVYGRSIAIPSASAGVARFNFSDLCDRALGPADYISIASRYHTIIIDNVPILPLASKNEARRFITLIDSLYETKTRLLVRAAAAPDSLFFPETTATSVAPVSRLAVEDDEVSMSARGGGSHPLSPQRIYEGDAQLSVDTRDEDALESEMLTDVLRDLEAPYRPNISSYSSTGSEDSAVLGSAETLKRPTTIDTLPVFRNLSIFSGEDERFAYARAVSRLCEMDSAAYVSGPPHQPLAEAARTWERPMPAPTVAQPPYDSQAPPAPRRAAAKGRKYDPLDEGIDPAGLDPPKFSSAHVWGVIDTWGKRAGRWGRGVRVFAEGGEDGKAKR